MLRYIAITLMLLPLATVKANTQDVEAIHDELRTVIQGLEQAINEERYDDLAPYFHKDLRVTTINQEIISSRGEIGEYFNRWFGPGGYLQKVDIQLRADAPTELYGNNSWGIVRGSGDEKYILSDSRKYDMKIRWTATVVKDTDGKWRIIALHIGTNFLDNPILNEVEGAIIYFGAGGVLIGILLMFIIIFIRNKIKKA